MRTVVKMDHLAQFFGVKIKQMFELPPPRVEISIPQKTQLHIDIYANISGPLEKRFDTFDSLHLNSHDQLKMSVGS